jgi:tripartite-type tricarboxylate transporter receptor subunit TctC
MNPRLRMQSIPQYSHQPSFRRKPESSALPYPKDVNFSGFTCMHELDSGLRQNDGVGVAGLLIKALAALLLTNTAATHAQTYPAKPIRYIIPFAPGGGQDLVGRALAPRLAEGLGQQMLIDNRPGGGTILGAELAARAAPDGYTIFMASNTSMSINPNLHAKLPYDPIKDFAPITRIATAANMLVVHPSMPVRSVKELAVFAKARPDQLNYGSSGSGTPAHLAGVMFNEAAGVKLVHVPYRGSSPALTAILSGETQLMFGTLTSSLQFVRSKRLRALAVSSAQRSPVIPELPTVAESGFPGYEAITWYGVVAPAGTPPAALSRLHSEFSKVLNNAEFKSWLLNQGAEAAPGTPDELAAQIKRELALYAPIIKKSGMKAD